MISLGRWKKYRNEEAENCYIVLDKEKKKEFNSCLNTRLWKEDRISKTGGIIFFAQENKIVDAVLVEKIIGDFLVLSKIYFFMLWKDWKWVLDRGWKKGELTIIKEKHALVNSYFRK
jgi:hypothetical protein